MFNRSLLTKVDLVGDTNGNKKTIQTIRFVKHSTYPNENEK